MGLTVLQLSIAVLLPVLLAAGLYQADKKTRFGKAPVAVKQAVFGIAFGCIAIFATIYGIPTEGAVLNVRNASPLIAGMAFGWPAGILAGLMGGIHRWFSQAGDFTRLACTLGTTLAGIIGAVVRRWMMENRRPAWFFGLTVGITTEVLHMLLVFLTNAADIHRAFTVVQICAVPMIGTNGLSVMLALIVISALEKRGGEKQVRSRNISQTMQRWLLVCVILAFGVTSLFTIFFQTRISDETTDQTLKTSLRDVKNDIRDASNRNMLAATRQIADHLPPDADSADLVELADTYDVTEINLIGEDGRIVASTFEDFVGYHMVTGSQSAAFLPLLGNETEIVQDYQPTTYDPSILRKYAGIALEEGFLQVGYDAARFQQEISEQVRYVAINRHIGQDGFIIICDETGTIISDRNGHEGENISIFGDMTEGKREFRRFGMDVYGTPSYCMYTTAEGYYIIGVLPKTEAMFSRNASIYILGFMEVIVFAALFALVFFLLRTLVVENIRKINKSLERITGGDLEEVVDVRGSEEFIALSDDINSTVDALKKYIEEAKARFDKELEIAKKIQHSALPSVFPPYPNRQDFSIFASMDAAKEVGGDFYDFYFLSDNQLAFLVADVSGKGIPGAMFMMTAKTMIKSHAETGLPVHEVFTQVNEELCENNEAGMFVTAWMGILDLETGLLRYANAGHNPPLVKRKDGSYQFLKEKVNFVLAGMEGVRYKEQQLQLSPGDEIYLYTDGVTEAHDTNKELFGEDRLLRCLNEVSGLSMEQICAKVKRNVDVFVGEAEQFDDITMLCVRFNELEGGALFTIEPTLDSVAKVTAFVEEQTELLEVPMKLSTKLMVAVDEIYSNIVHYSGAGSATLRIRKDQGMLYLTFLDDGKPYNPLEAEEPDITASAEDRAIGGLGIFMVRKMMDRVEYEYVQGQNKLTLALAVPDGV